MAARPDRAMAPREKTDREQTGEMFNDISEAISALFSHPKYGVAAALLIGFFGTKYALKLLVRLYNNYRGQ